MPRDIDGELDAGVPELLRDVLYWRVQLIEHDGIPRQAVPLHGDQGHTGLACIIKRSFFA
jgi:hypothetical protein